MKTLIACGLCVFSLGAQSRVANVAPRAQATGAVRSSGALGGPYLSPVGSRPLGGVAKPTYPSVGNYQKRGLSKNSGAARYVGPVYYVPNAYDTGYSGNYTDPSDYGPPPPPPTFVRQYFVSRGSSLPDAALQDGRPEAEQSPAPAVNAGDPLTEPASYYLIAYKDRSMYSALAYWIEGDTLHYVTTQNTHNQASLNLIDIERTYKLNLDQNVPFSVPAPVAR